MDVEPVRPGDPLAKVRVERQRQSDEMRDRRRVLEQVWEKLPPSLFLGKVEVIKGSGNTWHLRGDQGQNLGHLTSQALAQFIIDAPTFLKTFSDYIEVLEREAFDAREERRRRRDRDLQRDRLLSDITNELLAADDLGIHTKDGQRRVRSAVTAAKREDDDRRPYRY